MPPTHTQAGAILHFYKTLNFQPPAGVGVMNPYQDEEAWTLTSTFYEKFYSDTHPRIFIFGINPGRFGGGVTGIPFTDPIRLAEKCGIPNSWKKRAELSSEFIYGMIDEYGGPATFYKDCFFTALSPLGFVKEGKNLNYYDDKELLKACEPYMVQWIEEQLATISGLSTCFCLGEGENYKQFLRINSRHGFFKEIIPLPHPRWVMQYRRKRVEEFAALYVSKLKGFAVS